MVPFQRLRRGEGEGEGDFMKKHNPDLGLDFDNPVCFKFLIGSNHQDIDTRI